MIRTSPGDATVSGVAMLAGLGAGVYRSPSDAIVRCVQPGSQVEPDPEAAARYEVGYLGYRTLVDSAVTRRQDA
jgi:ribulose kinase